MTMQARQWLREQAEQMFDFLSERYPDFTRQHKIALVRQTFPTVRPDR